MRLWSSLPFQDNPPRSSKPPAALEGAAFRALLFRTVISPILLVTLLATLFIGQSYYLLSINRIVATSDRAIAQGHATMELMVDLETGVRGYLLTGKQEFLDPYRTSLPLIDSSMRLLESLISSGGDSGDRGALVKKAAERLGDWVAYSKHVMALRDHGENYQSYITSATGKSIMDEIRRILGQVIDQEQRHRDSVRDRLESMVSVLFWLTLALGVGAGGYLARFGRAQLLALSKSYSTALHELEKAGNELEKRVEERTVALRASNQELEAFSYSVSHDLRAPLRGIDGFSQALLEDYADKLDATGKSYLGFVRDGVQRMGKLIDDMLTLSRLTRTEMTLEKIDLSQLAKSIARQLQAQEPARPAQFTIPEHLEVVGDPTLIDAALENLLSNAWKFTSKVPVADIQLGVREKGGEREFFVRDNGAGFDMTYANKLFGAFQRLHSPQEFKGTGVGLATVRRIVSRHGGRVWAEAQPGKGATFYFTLSPSAVTGEKGAS